MLVLLVPLMERLVLCYVIDEEVGARVLHRILCASQTLVGRLERSRCTICEVSHLTRPYVPLVVPWCIFLKLCGGDEFLDGIAATLSRLQDRAQIFLAVLFWMSLFFWASVWDGKNNGKGRLNKGSRPKR
ncbi:hypothetical protein OIU84_022949 [Salix udensis]|uniref:Uncharacterized protein n=1 Tax=Salix udensis TaxID=889485 RepID=A0AAD6PEI2_9ROSI|nr:hypothetical protein OIU84_022949 [Salix udensis]